MKGKSKIKQGTVLLIAYVLVVGLVGLGGHVYGRDTDSASSEITVNAADVSVEINLLEQEEANLMDSANPVITDGENIDIELLVELDGGTDDDIETLKLDFEYDTEHDDAGAEGEAITTYLVSKEDGTDDADFTIKDGEDWGEGDETTDDQAIYEAALDIDPMMRYGEWNENSGWNVDAFVETTGDGDDDGSEDDDHTQIDVSTFVSLEVDGVDIEGTGAPGQTIGMEGNEDAEREWETTDEITEFKINAEYTMKHTVEGPFEEDDDNQWFEEMIVEYGNHESGDPISIVDAEINPDYTLEIPAGTEAGTYTGQITHTLTNMERDPEIKIVRNEDELADALADDTIQTIIVEEHEDEEYYDAAEGRDGDDSGFVVEYSQTIKAAPGVDPEIRLDENSYWPTIEVLNDAEGARIEGLTIDRSGVSDTDGAQAIAIRASEVEIHDNVITGDNSHDVAGIAVLDGIASPVEEDYDITNVRITDNDLTDFDQTEIALVSYYEYNDGGSIEDTYVWGNSADDETVYEIADGDGSLDRITGTVTDWTIEEIDETT